MRQAADTREAKDPAGPVGDSARKSDAPLCFDNVSSFACNRRGLSLRSFIFCPHLPLSFLLSLLTRTMVGELEWSCCPGPVIYRLHFLPVCKRAAYRAAARLQTGSTSCCRPFANRWRTAFTIKLLLLHRERSPTTRLQTSGTAHPHSFVNGSLPVADPFANRSLHIAHSLCPIVNRCKLAM